MRAGRRSEGQHSHRPVGLPPQGLWGHGSAVLRWNTDCQQWFHPKIREAEHYLSVDADNLISRIDYLADHEAEVRSRPKGVAWQSAESRNLNKGRR